MLRILHLLFLIGGKIPGAIMHSLEHLLALLWKEVAELRVEASVASSRLIPRAWLLEGISVRS